MGGAVVLIACWRMRARAPAAGASCRGSTDAGAQPRERFRRNHDGASRPLSTHHCLGASSWPRSCGLGRVRGGCVDRRSLRSRSRGEIAVCPDSPRWSDHKASPVRCARSRGGKGREEPGQPGRQGARGTRAAGVPIGGSSQGVCRNHGRAPSPLRAPGGRPKPWWSAETPVHAPLSRRSVVVSRKHA